MCSHAVMSELNFVILKVNGVDVSHLSHDKAVEMFLKATEPLLIEVRRKPQAQKYSRNEAETPSEESRGDDWKIASEITIASNLIPITKTPQSSSSPERELTLKFLPAFMEPVRENSLKNVCSKPTQTYDSNIFELQHHSAKEATDRFIEQEHNFFEQCLAPEIDIEEITLRKSDSNERLGLTVCYSGCSNNGSGTNNGALSGSDDNEACTEVYISDIQPDSVAGRDGRLRQGDQILQINGKDIKTKEETELLIAENNNAVTLLVSRYLYADEDDFNDPSVADLEDEEEDEEEEEEFYDDNNFGYENCFIGSEYINTDLDNVLFAESDQQFNTETIIPTSIVTPTTTSATTAVSGDEKNSIITEASSKKYVATAQKTLNTELSNTSSLNIEHTTKNNLKEHPQQVQQLVQKTNLAQVPTKGHSVPNIDYETEHIYETIPEDSESEPFYCSPYESSTYITAAGTCSSATANSFHLQQQKQRVAQWLGIKPNAIVAPSRAFATTAPKQSCRSSIGLDRSFTHNDPSLFPIRPKNGTVRSCITTVTNGSSSSGGNGCVGGSSINIAKSQNDEYDNSSSAYNTGGSNNSVTPLVLAASQNNRADTMKTNMEEEKIIATRCGKSQRLQSPKDVITSPKNSAIQMCKTQTQREIDDFQTPDTIAKMLGAATIGDTQPQFSPKTMYTNEANLHQTMILQQQMYRKALAQQHQQQYQHQQLVQQEQAQLTCCPQFTAPNLSKYHFVSSQEVRAANVNAVSTAVVVGHKSSNEESMVWKVKRRQDGTRYIVRRPARNRLLRDRSERLRKDVVTTTEDETTSEIKTGRYWSKEDRKKHIERARERRQQHHQNVDGSLPGGATSTMRISDKPATAIQDRNTANSQAVTRLHRPSATKHYQLQFNSCTPMQTQQLSGPNTANALTEPPSKALFLPSKSVSSNLHIGSPVDVSASTGTSILTATTEALSATTTTAASANAEANPLAGSATHPSQSIQKVADCNKLSNLLSVTTV